MSSSLIRRKRTKGSKKLVTRQSSKKKSSSEATIQFAVDISKEREEWMKELVVLRDASVLTDVKIITSDFKKFEIHSVVFAAISPYFRALYSNALYTENQNREVYLPDICSQIMQIIVQFVYTGRLVDTTEDNIDALLQASNRLQISGALDHCYKYLIRSLDVKNCISIGNFTIVFKTLIHSSEGIFQMAKMYFAIEVFEKTKLFILHNFADIANSCEDFYFLSSEELTDLFCDDRLNASREEVVYSALLSWTSVNSQRIEHFGKALKLIRFGNTSLEFVRKTVRKNALIKDNPELHDYMSRVFGVLSDIHADPSPSKFDIETHPFLRPRIPRDILFVFGGWSASNATNILETYDCRVNKWFAADVQSLISAPYRAYHGLISFGGLLYVIGGFDGRQHFNTVLAFDPLSRTWTEKSCMHIPRCYVSVALCDDSIYAMGGFDGNIRTSSAERYDVHNNQWQFIAHMQHQRSDASATAMAGKVYIVGGFNGNEVLSSSEVYDPKTNEWTLITNMTRPRSGVQLVQFDNRYLFAIGGNDGATRQTSVERYEPKTKKWTPMTHMSVPRSNFASIVLENLIYVIGGFNGNTTIAEVEAYNPLTDSWQEMWKMNDHRSALSACLVSGLENAKHYTWLRRELSDKSSHSRRQLNQSLSV